MDFRVGDKVSFLNEPLNGVVTKIINPKSVEVTTEDGFGIPVLIAELVKIQGDMGASEKEPEVPKVESHAFSQKHSLKQGTFLAFCPNGKQFDGYLINNKNYKAYFVLRTFKRGEWVALFSDQVSKQSFKFIGNFEVSEVEQFSKVQVDVLNVDFSIKTLTGPETGMIKIHPTKFYKDSSFSYLELIGKPAILQEIDLRDVKEEVVLQEVKEHVENTPDNVFSKLKAVKGPKIVGKINLSAKKVSSKELDLHIEKLIKSVKGKSNGEIVQIQINHARDFVDKAILNGEQEVVLIHGVGNGRLKAEVHKLLKSYYGIKFEQADFRKYGEGATLVYLK